MDKLNATELTSVSSFLKQPAENYGNREEIETQWAMAAYHHAEVYINLLMSVDARLLKLTPHDDDIYSEFRKTFPTLNVGFLDEDEMKSELGKAMWREFCNKFSYVNDFNMGTLLRLDASKGLTSTNTTFSTRIQFLAIEITRNREGLNDALKESLHNEECIQAP